MLRMAELGSGVQISLLHLRALLASPGCDSEDKPVLDLSCAIRSGAVLLGVQAGRAVRA